MRPCNGTNLANAFGAPSSSRSRLQDGASRRVTAVDDRLPREKATERPLVALSRVVAMAMLLPRAYGLSHARAMSRSKRAMTTMGSTTSLYDM